MGWIGTAFLILGRYQIGKRKNSGMFFSFIGDFLWMLAGQQTEGATGLAMAFTGGLMAILDLVGWHRQRKNNKYWNSMVIPKYMR